MIKIYYYKSMIIIWIIKLIGFSYDKDVTTNPPKLIEKADYGFRICISKKGYGIHRNYKTFINNFNKLNYEKCTV